MWQCYNNGHDDSEGVTHWLKDEHIIPSQLPGARIFTYDWSASTYRDAEDDNLFGHAKLLLSALKRNVNLSKSMMTGLTMHAGFRTTAIGVHCFVFWWLTVSRGSFVAT